MYSANLFKDSKLFAVIFSKSILTVVEKHPRWKFASGGQLDKRKCLW